MDNKNDWKSSRTQQLFITVLIQQHVSALKAIIGLAKNIKVYTRSSLLSKCLFLIFLINCQILRNQMLFRVTEHEPISTPLQLQLHSRIHAAGINFLFPVKRGTEIVLAESRHYVRGRQITCCIIKTLAKCHSSYRNVH